MRAALPSFHSTNRVSVSDADFVAIRATLTRLGVPPVADAATS